MFISDLCNLGKHGHCLFRETWQTNSLHKKHYLQQKSEKYRHGVMESKSVIDIIFLRSLRFRKMTNIKRTQTYTLQHTRPTKDRKRTFYQNVFRFNFLFNWFRYIKRILCKRSVGIIISFYILRIQYLPQATNVIVIIFTTCSQFRMLILPYECWSTGNSAISFYLKNS